MNLSFNLKFEDFYERSGLEKIDAAFIDELKAANIDLYNRILELRNQASAGELDAKDESNLLIELAPYLEDFIGNLFQINDDVLAMQKQHTDLADLYLCKRIFVQRRAVKIVKGLNFDEIDIADIQAKLEAVFGEELTEKSFAKNVAQWIDGTKGTDIAGCEDKVQLAGTYAGWALMSDAGRQKHKNGVIFKKPNKVDFENLVPVDSHVIDGVTVAKLAPCHSLRERDGFALTDDGFSLEQALDQANYCIYCHNQGKDSCAKGLREKADENGNAPYKISPTKVKQAGCPLEEKISEMNNVKAQGFTIGALGIITLDNPLCAATGHRICNDCMKGCIYQKQDAVNIPAVETRSLTDVLALPYGFEIYSLLTRWNPMNLRKPLPAKESGYKVLVAGLGPAGYSLSHHLINDGHVVVGVDGLKIEPLPSDISGVTPTGQRTKFKPIKNIESELYEPLDERVLAGFGGVAEYGITVRWNKNFLKVIRLLLERRQQFAMYGGVRFGSTITYDQAFEMGFDHVALCLGAGKPTIVSIPNALSRGVRTASDFLMSLQLSGAAKKDSIANIQVRLPVVVIGGGLTGIDAATEALAYYPLQVEKFLSRYEILADERGEENIRNNWGAEEAEIAEEFITHAKAIRAERRLAESENRDADIISLLQSWGGATMAYRRRLQDAPSYRLNHEEVEKAMEEGINFTQNVTPIRVHLDEYGHAAGLRVSYPFEGEDGRIDVREKTLPAKTIYMAAGTSPNTVLHREDKEHFELDHDGWFFKAIDLNGDVVQPEKSISKPDKVHVLMSKNDNGKFVSFFGDLHPTFVGNVVKALGSAKQGYPVLTKALLQELPVSNLNARDFVDSISDKLIATIHKVERLTSNIIEVVVHAPLAAQNFKPGQFYRLQNFETLSMKTDDGTTLAMEGLALTGAWRDKEKGLLSVIVLEMGGSSDLCAFLKKDEPVVLMGPTGEATEITKNQTIMLLGGGLGNAVLFSIGKAFKDAGNKVLYFAGYKEMQDRYKIEEIEKASDVIVWCCDNGEFTPDRPQDKTYHGNIIKAIEAYSTGQLGEISLKTSDCDRMIVIGSHGMMAAVKAERFNSLQPYLKAGHKAIGSINSPMQCMMKEICAQCLQRHIDPETGERYYVYSCFNQDQDLDYVDFQHLNERLKQNNIQEKITKLWIDRALKSLGLRDDRSEDAA